jgi:2-oxoglutarate ferredoxin oxidoreductase subunit delta
LSARRVTKADSATEEIKKGEHIHIYDAWCKACGICVAICPRNVLATNEMGYPYVANEADCTRCGICELHCPDFAIDVQRVGEVPFEAAHLARLQSSPSTEEESSPLSGETLPPGEDNLPAVERAPSSEKKPGKKVENKTGKKKKPKEKAAGKQHKRPKQ